MRTSNLMQTILLLSHPIKKKMNRRNLALRSYADCGKEDARIFFTMWGG
jgi:hypothetical protein